MSDAMPEEWRPAPGHIHYQVSSLGRVRSFKRRQPVVMQGVTDAAGYHRVVLDGVRYSTHRLIAAAFIGICPGDKEVDHINDVRGDNRAANLQYLTRAENLAKRERARVLPTECPKGHPYSGDNLYLRPSGGSRDCRACRNQYFRERRLAQQRKRDAA